MAIAPDPTAGSHPSRFDLESSPSTPFFAVVSLLLGLLVGVLALAALGLWVEAHNAANSADRAAATSSGTPSSMPGMDTGGTANAGTGALTSYAGAAPENAEALAAAHKPFPAALPAAPAGDVANVDLVLKDVTIEIAPGIKYAAWAWAGGAPGPVIHVRQGQLVHITLTNAGAISHSVDFHAARVAPDKVFGDVMPGKSVSYTFKANDPGVFM